MKKSDYSEIKQLTSAEKLLYHSKGGEVVVGVLVTNPYRVGVVGLSSHIIIKLAAENGALVERYYSDSLGTGLRAWASGRQASELDMLLCSVSYEPDLLVLAEMLKQGGISPSASGRRADDPIVVVGGVAVLGAPHLAAQIGDIVCWGEAEVIIPSLLSKLKECLGQNRVDVVNQLTAVAGVKAGGREIVGADDIWRYYNEFRDDPGHSVIITPYGEFGASFLVELVRGCPHGCRHCFACRAQAPFRIADPKTVVGLAAESGCKKIGLVGLGVASHPQFLFILESLNNMSKTISTASLTAEDLSLESMRLIAGMGQRTLTLSPEAGSESLRESIGKMATESQWLKVAEDARKAGFKALRLYFMVGVPRETNEDLVAIGSFVAGLMLAFRGKISTTLAPFVPKPFTPWQGYVLLGGDEWKRRLSIVRSHLAMCTVRVESHRYAMLQWNLGRISWEDSWFYFKQNLK